jgi:hypothetical protein
MFGCIFLLIQSGYGIIDRHIRPFPGAVPLTGCSSFPASIWTYNPMPETSGRVADDLFDNIRRLNNLDKSFGTLLSEASCWHALFRTGIDSAKGMSENILRTLSKTAPGSPEIAWISGMNLLWSGKVNKGLRTLHAIRAAEFNDDTDLTRDYLKTCARCLLPSNCSAFSKKIFLQTPTYPGWDIFTRVEETFPEMVTLKEYSRTGYDSLPSLVLSATFEMAPMRLLDLPRPGRNGCRLIMNIDSSISSKIPKEPLDDPFADRSKMEIQIVALPGVRLFPAEAQIISMIDGKFDYVRKVNDLERFGAVGVRCGKRSVFRNVAGSYYAFVGFDARVYGNKGKISIKPVHGSAGKETVPVRYLIVLKSCEDIEIKAERILQNVLSCFNKES